MSNQRNAALNDGPVLNNGVQMPWLGLGYSRLEKEQSNKCSENAIDAGYRSIDTAAYYQNETGGKAIRESGVPRKRFLSLPRCGTVIRGIILH